jgi:DNA phosphorothioation-associated putative methyltransferase
VGRIPDFTLVKLSHDKRAVSWLGYPDFDSDPHPRTSWSFQVTFPELATKFQDFSHRANRPLLHRKEEFLAPEDPQRLKYERLTRSEVKAGLYANPHMIGTEDGWAAELLRCGVELRGHRLVRLAL